MALATNESKNFATEIPIIENTVVKIVPNFIDGKMSSGVAEGFFRIKSKY